MGILLNTARNAAADGILSTREVGKLVSKSLEDGKVTRGEVHDLKKVQAEMYDQLTPEARRAINSFLSLGSSFEPNLAGRIFGVTDEQGDAMEMAGIRTPQELLLKGKTEADRRDIAGVANLDEVLVTSLTEQADLARTVGVGAKYAAVLHGVGINDVQELAQQNAVALRRQITSYLKTTEGRAITGRRPGLNTVKGWIESAKQLPRMITQMGDRGADFTRDNFDALQNYQKGMLLFGYDIRVPGGFVFDASQLEASNVLRKPAPIGDLVDKLVDGKFDGAYESTELVSIERVKVGDDTLGYRMTFEVVGEAEMDYEGASVGDDVRVRGTVDIAVDNEGQILSQHDYVDYDYDSE